MNKVLGVATAKNLTLYFVKLGGYHRLAIAAASLFGTISLNGQSPTLPHHQTSAILAERIEVLTGQPLPTHSPLHACSAETLVGYVSTVSAVEAAQKHLQQDIDFIQKDNILWSEKSLPIRPNRWQRFFFRDGIHLIQVRKPDFKMSVNPSLQVGGGKENADPSYLLTNRRGVAIQGAIDRKVWFYTDIVEQQMRFPQYVTNYIVQTGAVPGAGFYKAYNSTVLTIKNGYDYNIATAAIGFDAGRHWQFQFGHGQQFIGNGYRSMLLSDFGNNYLYLKSQYRIGRFQYQYLLMEQSPWSANRNPGPGDDLLEKKYAAVSYLSVRPIDRWTLGVAGGHMFSNSDAFRWYYLDPVSGYSLYHDKGEGLMGITTTLDPIRGVRFYGQWWLNGRSQRWGTSGWWGNRRAWQAGVKYFNVLGIPRLDLQGEWNQATPYTYAASNPTNSWTHYRHPLAHPFGAGFRESIVLLNYRPSGRWQLSARYIAAQRTASLNSNVSEGDNPLLSTDIRPNDSGHQAIQGDAYRTELLGIDVTFRLFHQCFLEMGFLSRQSTPVSGSAFPATSERIAQAGLRWNLPARRYDF